MPTKKQLQEQLNQRIEDTLKLQEKQNELGKVLDSTTENRLKQLTDIKNAENDVNRLNDIQVDLTSEVNRLLEIGHSSVADIYKVEQDIITNKIKEIGYQSKVNDLITGAIANA